MTSPPSPSPAMTVRQVDMDFLYVCTVLLPHYLPCYKVSLWLVLSRLAMKIDVYSLYQQKIGFVKTFKPCLYNLLQGGFLQICETKGSVLFSVQECNSYSHQWELEYIPRRERNPYRFHGFFLFVFGFFWTSYENLRELCSECKCLVYFGSL